MEKNYFKCGNWNAIQKLSTFKHHYNCSGYKWMEYYFSFLFALKNAFVLHEVSKSMTNAFGMHTKCVQRKEQRIRKWKLQGSPRSTITMHEWCDEKSQFSVFNFTIYEYRLKQGKQRSWNYFTCNVTAYSLIKSIHATAKA